MFLEGYETFGSNKPVLMRSFCTNSPNKAIRLKNVSTKTHYPAQSVLSSSSAMYLLLCIAEEGEESLGRNPLSFVSESPHEWLTNYTILSAILGCVA